MKTELQTRPSRPRWSGLHPHLQRARETQDIPLAPLSESRLEEKEDVCDVSRRPDGQHEE